MKNKFVILFLLLFPAMLLAAENEKKEEAFNPKEVIFEHLGDEYGWKLKGETGIRLPVIVRDDLGKWHLFTSGHLEKGNTHEGFYIAPDGDQAGKILGTDGAGNAYRPLDLSITKNVFALFIAALCIFGIIFPLVRWYKRNPLKAPRRGLGIIEMVVEMLYMEVIVSVLGKESKRFAPYLLTVFFFILVANLLGLIVVFPGGANIMGNISITLVLALCTFVVVTISGTKAYWKDIFWPDVPLWLKCPIPLMPLIEIFGMITKPIALMIRLFANMLGGHLIVLVVISMIFIFGSMGAAILGTTTVFAVVFAVFINLIDLLVCFIQAYVFMMLSTIFIGLARVKSVEKQGMGVGQLPDK